MILKKSWGKGWPRPPSAPSGSAGGQMPFRNESTSKCEFSFLSFPCRWSFVVVVYYANHGVNFILYCVSGRQFRNDVKRTLRKMCCRPQEAEDAVTRPRSVRMESSIQRASETVQTGNIWNAEARVLSKCTLSLTEYCFCTWKMLLWM